MPINTGDIVIIIIMKNKFCKSKHYAKIMYLEVFLDWKIVKTRNTCKTQKLNNLYI